MDREISIQVPAFDSFITEYSANISTTGMFIKSEKPLPPETELGFEFKIADDWKLIRGQATVVWCRYRDEGPDRPPGMGVQFTDLEPQSRRLIDWIIEKHVRDGGKPFDLDELRGLTPDDLKATGEPKPPAAGSAAAAQPTPPAGSPRARGAARPGTAAARKRSRLVPLLLTGFAVALLLAGLFWLSERGAQSAANPELSSEADSTGDAEPDAPSPPAAPEAEAAESIGAAPPTAQPAVSPVFLEAARRLVDGWSRAWSAQDVDAYLAYYTRRFAPPRGQSRSAWAEDRRQRLTAPEFIEISIDALEVEVIDESRSRVTFTQGYRSDTYQDEVRKTLDLVREDGRWKILEEKSGG